MHYITFFSLCLYHMCVLIITIIPRHYELLYAAIIILGMCLVGRLELIIRRRAHLQQILGHHRQVLAQSQWRRQLSQPSAHQIVCTAITIIYMIAIIVVYVVIVVIGRRRRWRG